MPSDLQQARVLTAEDLGIPLPANEVSVPQLDAAAPAVSSDDPFVLTVAQLLERNGGVLLSGAPGTGKSWWAQRIAEVLAPDGADRSFVQFHASYQYEDFIYGYVPNAYPKPGEASFIGRKAIFLQACERAEHIAPKPFVLVIDEFSRADVGRVFGEALTYIEDTKRGRKFRIAADVEVSVPKNLYILATMNPYDRGVDEVDAAFERRFARLELDPDPKWVEDKLLATSLPPQVVKRVLAWFGDINSKANQRDAPFAALGHAYFKSVVDLSSLRDLWDYQLQFHVRRAFRLNAERQDHYESGWSKIFRDVEGGVDGQSEPDQNGVSEPEAAS
ncbi:MAG: AAA family ATPase [Propionibacteriaceae bacterium]